MANNFIYLHFEMLQTFYIHKQLDYTLHERWYLKLNTRIRTV